VFGMTDPSATATIEIAAPAERIYALVTDLPRMDKLAEENRGGRWLGRATRAVVGAKFRGTNRNGSRTWCTTARVTDLEPGRRFGFNVTVMLGIIPIARWEYTLEQNGTGCRVTESTWDRRPHWFRPISELRTGTTNRSHRNQRHIQRTLERLKTTAEAF
jgi:hypothetical protein